MYASPFSFDAERGAISSVQRTLILKTFPGFSSLSAEQLATMSTICRERFFAAGTTMLEPGKPVESFFLVVEGEVCVRRDGEVVQRLGPRTTVGGLAAITRAPEGTHAIAESDVLALEVASEDMNEVFEDNFALLVQVLLAMARTIRELQLALGKPLLPDATQPPLTRVKHLTLVDKVLLLRSSSAMGIQEVEALTVLAASAQERRYEPNAQLWSAGDASGPALLIIAGEVRCQQPGREPYRVGPGWMLGFHDMLTRLPHHHHAETESALRVLVLQRDPLLDMLEDYSDMAQLALRRTASGIHALLDVLAARKRT